MKRINVLITALIVVSVGSNILNAIPPEKFKWPEVARYDYHNMFDDSVVFYRPKGSDGLAMIDMTDSIITVTKFGSPLNCMLLNIHTKDGLIKGDCVSHTDIAEPEDE